MPTLRTLFSLSSEDAITPSIDKVEKVSRLIAFTLTGMLLLLFAAYGQGTFLNGIYIYPARYGYVGDLVILISFLALISRLSAPQKAAIIEDMYVSDDPKFTNVSLTSTQLEVRNTLADIMSNGRPRSIALTGDWGSGKTLVYNRAKIKAAEKHDNIVWVEFDPWRYASEEALVTGFYEVLARTIDNEIAGYQNALRDIMANVSQFVSKGEKTGLLQLATNQLQAWTTLSNEPDKIIQGLLDREGKRMVIIMDDIERQYDRDRTYRALELVHHAKGISERIQIICVYEKETLLNAAPLHINSREEYLEKFSEIEINIPEPEISWLRSQLEELINNSNYNQHLPDEMDLNISPAGIKDIKSHRGIIRAFNEFLLDFHKLKARSDDPAHFKPTKNEPVNDGDRFMMGHLKLKYPLIYSDIARNRNIYTQSKEIEQTYREMFMDDAEQRAQVVRHFDLLFVKAELSAETTELVKEFLQEIFPTLKAVYDKNNRNINLDELRAESRIGYRNVLDAYFASTQSQDAYLRTKKLIDELIGKIPNSTDEELSGLFRTYMETSKSDESELDNETLLRNELLKHKNRQHSKPAFRAWLRVLMQGALEVEDINRVLGRVLSALNELYITEELPNKRMDFANNIFGDIEDYTTDPHAALLLLLFLLPDRGNQYFTAYVNQEIAKDNGIYEKLLAFVDDHFINGHKNVYVDYRYEEYSFIIYQWSLSISAGSSRVNKSVHNSSVRYVKVNDYIFSILNANSLLAYQVLHDRFWSASDDGRADELEIRIDVDKCAPYDLEKLVRFTESLSSSAELQESMRNDMKELTIDIRKFIKDTHQE